MNYDSRSTWDSGLDAGSIPARSIKMAAGLIGKSCFAKGGKKKRQNVLSFLFFFTIMCYNLGIHYKI